MPRAERSELVGLRLLRAAREIFVERGYHGATLDEIADRAGFTKGVVYSRFESKADLFLKLLTERIELRSMEVEAIQPAPGEGVDRVFHQWLDRVRRDPVWSLVVMEFRLVCARDPALNARYAAIHERLLRSVGNAVQRAGLANGQHVRDPLDAARVGLAFSTGVLLERARDPRAFPESLAERANTALFEGVTRQKRGGRTRTRRTRRAT